MPTRRIALAITLSAVAVALGTAAQIAQEKQESPDLLIIGAGISGLSAALEAARGGASVLVVDMSTVGGGHAILARSPRPDPNAPTASVSPQATFSNAECLKCHDVAKDVEQPRPSGITSNRTPKRCHASTRARRATATRFRTGQLLTASAEARLRRTAARATVSSLEKVHLHGPRINSLKGQITHSSATDSHRHSRNRHKPQITTALEMAAAAVAVSADPTGSSGVAPTGRILFMVDDVSRRSYVQRKHGSSHRSGELKPDEFRNRVQPGGVSGQASSAA